MTGKEYIDRGDDERMERTEERIRTREHSYPKEYIYPRYYPTGKRRIDTVISIKSIFAKIINHAVQFISKVNSLLSQNFKEL